VSTKTGRNKNRCLFYGCLIGIVGSNWSAGVHAQQLDGYVGVFADSAGTLPCANVPPFSGTLLYVLAKIASPSVGITGAEFRIEVTSSSGWWINYTAPIGQLAVGNPLDVDPDPSQGGGVNISFTSCQLPNAHGVVRLGTLSVVNLNGDPTQLLVKRHTVPRNADFSCPLFTRCDGPTFSKACMALAPPDTCALLSLKAQKRRIASSSDEPVFVSVVNQQGHAAVPGFSDTLSSAAREMRERALAAGIREVDLRAGLKTC
jgi:hypothetical protein